VLAYPIVAVNEAQTKHMFDNQYGHGPVGGRRHPARDEHPPRRQRRSSSAGYGWVGRGIAERFRGMGSLGRRDRGRRAARPRGGDGRLPREPVAEAARIGDLFITATGNVNVIGRQHFTQMKDGAILANAGHFNDEIELGALEKLAKSKREVRRFVEEYQLADRKIFVLGEGRLVNHVAAEANPAAVMDMSFANQAPVDRIHPQERRQAEAAGLPCATRAR
jgi:adenosylhomocysteinase